jgi:hypothetical protein
MDWCAFWEMHSLARAAEEQGREGTRCLTVPETRSTKDGFEGKIQGVKMHIRSNQKGTGYNEI